MENMNYRCLITNPCKKIFGCKKNKGSERYEILQTGELNVLYRYLYWQGCECKDWIFTSYGRNMYTFFGVYLLTIGHVEDSEMKCSS
jgi:hypothetical protein